MLRRVPVLLRWGALACLVSLHAAAQPVDDATRDAARSLGLSGVDAYQAGNYELASSRLEKAYGLLNVPSLGLWAARALAKRNLLVEAANRYYEVTSLQLPQGDAAVQRQAQTDAQTELDQLRPQIPRLLIRMDGADAAEVTLSIDGQAAPSSIIGKPRLVNPGSHQVEARLAATQKSASVEASLGKEATVVLDFSKAASGAPASSAPVPGADRPASSGSARRTLGWVGVGAGGVGIALGGVMGAFAISKRSALRDSGCTDSHCPYDEQADVNRLNTFRTVSSVGFIAGGVLATTGIVLLLSAPSGEHQLAALVSGNAVTFTGRF